MEMYSLMSVSLLFKVTLSVLLLRIKGEEESFTSTSRDVFKYFPEAQNDASRIQFHRANSKVELEKNLKSGVMMYGDLWQMPNKTIVATSLQSSYIALEDWLTAVCQQKVGIKLNFNDQKVVEPALRILKRFDKEIGPSRPVWLRAEVAEGPYNTKSDVLLDRKFFNQRNAIFPNSVLALAWSTFWNNRVEPSQEYYPWESIWEMILLLEKEKINQQQINFEFRLPFIYISENQIRLMLDIFKDSTITIRAASMDSLHNLKLMKFHSKFNHSRVFYSLPPSFPRLFGRKNSTEYKYDHDSNDYIFSDIWKVKSPQKGVYIGSQTAIVPAKSVLISKHKYGTRVNRTVILTGKISVVANDYYNTLVRINFYNSLSSFAFSNCSFSSKATAGCDVNPKKIILNRYMRCFIFKVEIMDNGHTLSKVGDALRIDACHYDINDYTSKSDHRQDYSIYTFYDKETAWNKVKNFENVSIEIQTESNIGYVVLERLSVLGEIKEEEVVEEEPKLLNEDHDKETSDYDDDEDEKKSEEGMAVTESNYSYKISSNPFCFLILFYFYFMLIDLL